MNNVGVVNDECLEPKPSTASINVVGNKGDDALLKVLSVGGREMGDVGSADSCVKPCCEP